MPSAPAAPGNDNGEMDEFVELYNNTDADLDLSGYILRNANGVAFTLPAGASIPARGHYLIANSAGYALTGFAALHTLTMGMKSRVMVLGLTYAMVLVLGWPIPTMVGLGLADASPTAV